MPRRTLALWEARAYVYIARKIPLKGQYGNEDGDEDDPRAIWHLAAYEQLDIPHDRRAVPRNAEKSAILSRSVLGISSSPGNDLGRF